MEGFFRILYISIVNLLDVDVAFKILGPLMFVNSSPVMSYDTLITPGDQATNLVVKCSPVLRQNKAHQSKSEIMLLHSLIMADYPL